jgi:hypothetical protein
MVNICRVKLTPCPFKKEHASPYDSITQSNFGLPGLLDTFGFMVDKTIILKIALWFVLININQLIIVTEGGLSSTYV